VRLQPARVSDWIHELTTPERDDLVAAGRGDASFPVLGPVIDGWADELDAGRGYLLVRGFPVDELDEPAVEQAYRAVGERLGVLVSQNTDGDLIGHVRDDGSDPDDPNVRLYRTRAAQPFHTDGSDVVGLLCLQPAKAGGLSTIVRSDAVFTEVNRRRPDLADLWFHPFHLDLHGQEADGQAPTLPMPIASRGADGRLRTLYLRWYIEQAQRHPDVPRLTTDQIEFLDLVDAVADELRADMDFRPGDVQLLSNAVVLHGRTEYEDWPEPESRRHLLRLWLTLHRNAPEGAGVGGIPTKHG